MNAPFRVTAATPAEARHAMAVMDGAFEPLFGEAWSASQLSGVLVSPNSWMRLAWSGDAPIGFSVARIVLDEAELLLLGVARAHQRRGTGARLLDLFCSDAAARGARRLFLEVRDGNAANLLYRRHGFAVAGRRRDYYRGADGNLFDALTFARDARQA